MKWLILHILLLISFMGFSQKKTTYVGLLGDTGKIEMEISTSNEKDYMGRYRYQGKKEWTLLKGAMYYDKRNKIAQNLVLYEFGQSKDTSVFDLYMEGQILTGTWQQNRQSGISAVNLSIGEPDRSNVFDGSYLSVNGKNEMSVKTVANNTIEVNIILNPTDKCEEIRLSGTLIKVGEEWKGSLPDQNDKGGVSVVIAFAESGEAEVQLVPAFTVGPLCNFGKESFLEKMEKKKPD